MGFGFMKLSREIAIKERIFDEKEPDSGLFSGLFIIPLETLQHEEAANQFPLH